MYCPMCGATNDEGREVCGDCGAPLGPPVAQQPYQPAPVYRAQPGGQMSYAGFWKRFAAYIIDGIILSIVTNVLAAIIIGGSFYSVRGGDVAGVRVALLEIVSIVIAWLYFALLESSSSRATVGKMALGIVVTDLQGNRVSFGRATGRFFGKIISSIILLIGYIMAAFTERKQALHDMMAGTLVVNKWSV